MRRFRLKGLLALVSVFTLVAVACGEEPATSPTGGTTGTGTDTSTPAEEDLLARIQSEGVIRVATDQKYKPQSWYDAGSEEWMGFDVDVANEIAARLGVEAEINHQEWDLITAGSWLDRWDISVGSMTVTEDRLELFEFSPAYYFTPASVAVHESNTTISDLTTDLDGKKVCVGSSTTYESYLKGELVIPGYTIENVIDSPEIVTYGTDTDALDNLALGDGARCDAVITATPTVAQFVDDGGPVKLVGDPLYGEPLAMAFDKASPIDNASLVAEVTQIVEDMHADGTLSELSLKWYGIDISVA
jgi:polar amino acid transport system substrate-binding protein